MNLVRTLKHPLFITVFPLALLGALLVYEVMTRYPINHVGFEPRWILALLCISGIFIAFQISHRASLALVFGVVMLPLLTSLVVDRCNLLVTYESWLQRGMPAVWQCDITKF